MRSRKRPPQGAPAAAIRRQARDGGTSRPPGGIGIRNEAGQSGPAQRASAQRNRRADMVRFGGRERRRATAGNPRGARTGAPRQRPAAILRYRFRMPRAFLSRRLIRERIQLSLCHSAATRSAPHNSTAISRCVRPASCAASAVRSSPSSSPPDPAPRTRFGGPGRPRRSTDRSGGQCRQAGSVPSHG